MFNSAQTLSKLIRITSALCALSFPMSFLMAGPGGYGGTASIADAEIARRYERINQARTLEAEGDRAMRDLDFEGALSKYYEALALIPPAPMTAHDRTRIIRKFADACDKHADKLGKMGKIDEAKAVLKRVLVEEIDIDNAKCRTRLKWLDDPVRYNVAMSEGHFKNTEEVTRLLRLGLGYYDLGQFPEAEATFNKILLIDSHNTAARRNLEKVEREKISFNRASRDHLRQKALNEVDESWAAPIPRTSPVGNPGFSEAGEPASPILVKLKAIKLPRLSFEQASIEEVISWLTAKSREFDPMPDKTGVNFIPPTKKQGSPITLEMRDVPMLVALDQITSLAGLYYRVDSHAVVVTTLEERVNKIETRTFRVPPDFLNSAGQLEGGGGGSSLEPTKDDPFATPTPNVSGLKGRPKAKDVLIALGVPFPEGADATFLPATGRLVVKNTIQNLDYIEKLIEDMNKKIAKQVNVTTKFVEISQRNTEELGFDTLIGAFNIGGDRTFGSGGTSGNGTPLSASDYPFLAPAIANPVPIGSQPVSGGLRSGGRAITSGAIDGLLSEGIGGGGSLVAPGIFALAGVFSDPQFQIVMRALSQKKGVDLLTAPSIVTRSGQRAKIEVIREFPYPTDFDPPTIPQTFANLNDNNGGGIGPGGVPIAGGGGGGVNSFPVVPTTPTAFEVRNTGVSMEVDPVIGEDGYTIELNLAPEVVEFEGFINYGSPISTGAVNALGVPTTVVLTENRIEQPVFATRKLTTAVTIWNGQTVGIGGLIREDAQMVEDKVPFFGDIPLVGRLFRTKSEEHFKKNLMIYVSATLLDPSGAKIDPPGGPQEPMADPGLGASTPLIP